MWSHALAQRGPCAGGDADSGDDGRVCSEGSGRGGGKRQRPRRQRGSGISGGGVGSEEAMMGEDAVEVDEHDSGASSGGDDKEDGGLGEGGRR